MPLPRRDRIRVALRRLYRAGEIWIIRATGVMFIGFAVTTLWQALRPAIAGG